MRSGRQVLRTMFSAGSLIALAVLCGGAFAAGRIALDSSTAAISAAGAMFLVWLLVVLTIGMSRAKKAFCQSYAQERGLQWGSGGAVPTATPLLRRGDSRRAEEAFTGKLPGGLDGTIALYTYEERGSGGAGNTQELHHFTVVLASLPDLSARLPALYVQRRSGFRFLDGAEDAFRATERIKLESEQLDRRCEIFADPGCDANWLRQLFSPSFVDFLADKTPEGFAFEVENGVLCINVNRHRGSAVELDELSTAAARVAGRIREEAGE